MATGSWGTVLRRGVDTVCALSDLAAAKISAAVDPRARLRRRRRRALRWGLVFSAGCLFWASVTVLLAAWGWFTLLLVATGSIAVLQAILATLLLLRYRWLRSLPPPARGPVDAGRLPPPGSAARPAMAALGASQRGFVSLMGVMESTNMLPANEIRDLTDAAERSAAAMTATAVEVMSMEQAVRDAPSSRAYLAPTVDALTRQLSVGVRQYNEMVTAAAQLVSSANSGSVRPAVAAQRCRNELADATDRLMGWTQAFDELGGLPRV
ncbi:hypothetical protein [Mycobacterium sp.]|uniref:phage shock envelope stress response protein PspM n=1 Tax=Mycobacterium sp. TaxID=1785 RepID=UPI0031CE7478